MGRGDKRSRKGKIFAGSFGNSRTQRTKSAAVAPTAVKKEKVAKAEKPATKKAPAKKAAAKKKTEE